MGANISHGTERYGIIASSGAKRLRADGVTVPKDIEIEKWFLNGKDDVNSVHTLWKLRHRNLRFRGWKLTTPLLYGKRTSVSCKKFSCTRGEIYRINRLDKDSGFEWIGEYDISADDLLSGNCRGKKIKEAKEFLLEILADGAVEQNVIVKKSESRGMRLSITDKRKGDIR